MPNFVIETDAPDRGTERRTLLLAARRRKDSPRAFARAHLYLRRLLAESGNATRLASRLRMSFKTLESLMVRLDVRQSLGVPIPAILSTTLTSAEELKRWMDNGQEVKAQRFLHYMFDTFESQAGVARALEIHWKTLREWMTKLHVDRRGRTAPARTEIARLMRTDYQAARSLIAGALAKGGSRNRASKLLGVHRRTLAKYMTKLGIN